MSFIRTTHRTYFAAVVALGALLLAGLVTVGPVFAAFPGQNGKIAYETVDGDDIHVSVMNADGSGQTQLIPPLSFDPAWSPTGQQIAFAGSQDGEGHNNIYAANADGSGVVSLTPSPSSGNGGSGVTPTWSPNGAFIAYNSGGNIWRMNADGGGKTQLAAVGGGPAPAWSPDGTKIAFVGLVPGGTDIFVMNPDGTGQTNLTNTSVGTERNPDWSPDGSKIVYQRAVGEAHVWSMNADGSGQTDLTDGPGESGALPAWSPDGARIVFDRGDIFVMNPDGTGVTPLNTPVATPEHDPNWQPAVPAGYPRPAGGAQFRVPLAIAYRPCGGDRTPNRTHGPALSQPSCNPAFESSKQVTVGTNDAAANGFPPQSTGFIKITVCVNGTTASGVCSTPAGMSAPDIRIQASVTDVRCRPERVAYQGCQGLELSDYVGELQGVLTLRITDKHNSSVTGATADAATVSDLAFPFTVPCTANPAGGDPSAIGASCTVLTRANAVTPGSVNPGKRANIEIATVEVFDGGSDGDVDTPGNILFERQGIFIP